MVTVCNVVSAAPSPGAGGLCSGSASITNTSKSSDLSLSPSPSFFFFFSCSSSCRLSPYLMNESPDQSSTPGSERRWGYLNVPDSDAETVSLPLPRSCMHWFTTTLKNSEGAAANHQSTILDTTLNNAHQYILSIPVCSVCVCAHTCFF